MYRCKILPGSQWRRASNEKMYPFLSIPLEVIGGESAGARMNRDIFFSPGPEGTVAKGYVQTEFAVLDVDLKTTNLTQVGIIIEGKEVAGEARITPANKPGGRDFISCNRISPLAALTPGTVEADVAKMLGNTVTPAPDPDAFNDRY